MTKKITSNQENRIADLVRDAVRALGFSKDEAQEIIKVGGMLQEKVKPILQKLAMMDQRFGSGKKPEPIAPAESTGKFALLADLGIITVPDDYDHATALAKFLEK
ncbi:MAG: hypothetical protein HYV76_02825, partial [Candidatus Vogelbacteria bacterium]|nr:hypothetical protein [Candidatus Vogelbacteria bacterium]